jgi:hypothetical protein
MTKAKPHTSRTFRGVLPARANQSGAFANFRFLLTSCLPYPPRLGQVWAE